MSLLGNHLINRAEQIHHHYVGDTELVEGFKHKINLNVDLFLVYQPCLYLLPLFKLRVKTFLDNIVYARILFDLERYFVLFFKKLSENGFRENVFPFFPKW